MLGLLALGQVGTLVELVSLGHYQTAEQMIPVTVVATGLLLTVWVAVRPQVVAVRLFQFGMLVFVGTGVIGITLHAQVAQAALAIAGDTAVPPVLSPGILVQLGLLGLLCTHSHPVLAEEER
jgi:hypothetical protein